MLAASLTAAILAVACFFSGLLEMGHFEKMVAWHLVSAVSGIVACTLFLVWTAQKLIP